jgi:cytochrome c-type biogenesis protein CcmF
VNHALGYSAVLLGFLAAVAGTITLAVGLVRKQPAALKGGRSYVWLMALASVVACGVMERALLTNDFSLKYVVNNDSLATPTLFKVTAMWSALAGSILLWALVLTGYLVVMTIRFRDRITDPLVGWATLTCFAVAAFFFGLMLTVANPFSTTPGIATDGTGPNPLLQNHPLVAFHPPMLYLGYVGFTVPFAFAVAALVTGRVGEGWSIETRRWTLFAWGFLTIGIVLGAWWSYQVLGWGGFWAWDPVENASFLPWLTATAYLHSVMVQERRGMLRVWNLSLVIATFSLTILGTFLTRSGVLDSVHAFTTSAIGPVLLGFFGVVVAVGIGLIAWRGDALRSPGSIDSPVSREGAFLFNNLLFAAFAFVVLLGTVFPLISEALNGQRLSVGGPYFDRMTAPIGMALLFLMAVAPVLPWRKASGELLRNRLQWPAWFAVGVIAVSVLLGVRGPVILLTFGLGAFAAGAAVRQLVLAARRQGWRGLAGRANGGMIVHLGVVIIAVAFASSHSFGHRGEVSVGVGESARVAGHQVTLLSIPTVQHRNRTSIEAHVRLDGGRVYVPAISNYPAFQEGIGTPSVHAGLRRDVYVTLVAAPDKPGDPAVIGVIVQPLVTWLWIGGLIIALGTVLAAWPGRRRRTPLAAASAPIPGVEISGQEAEDDGARRAPVGVAFEGQGP